MIFRYMGHSFFTVTLENGSVYAFDPYGAFYAYPERRIPADTCLVSHHHGDHDGTECVSGFRTLLDQPGIFGPERGVTVLGIPTWHDHHQGKHRGDNVFFVLEAEGLRVGHAGDLGHPLTREQVMAIGSLDVLLLPVGGYYTQDAREAEENRRLLSPRVTIPMHYRTEYNPEMPIAPLQDYLTLTGAKDTGLEILRVVEEDLSEREPIITMAVWNR